MVMVSNRPSGLGREAVIVDRVVGFEADSALLWFPDHSVAEMASAFTTVLVDDSQDEPEDFDVPGDDFGS